jgi:hypothetical protein
MLMKESENPLKWAFQEKDSMKVSVLSTLSSNPKALIRSQI